MIRYVHSKKKDSSASTSPRLSPLSSSGHSTTDDGVQLIGSNASISERCSIQTEVDAMKSITLEDQPKAFLNSTTISLILNSGFLNEVEKTAMKLSETLEIAEIVNFSRELVDGYDRTYYVHEYDEGDEIESNSLVEGGEERKERVDMSKPRKCSYDTYDIRTEKKIGTVTLGDEYDAETRKMIDGILLGGPSPKSSPTIPPVQVRGITLRQLRAIMANIKRRCLVEGWTNWKGEPLSPDQVNLYDLDRYLIRPFTVKCKQSLVTRMPSTAGSQPPRFFVSHWWGETVKDFIACIEQAVRDFAMNYYDNHEERGGGMSQDTPVWVCAYGNNQWNLADITEDPQDSGFAKAMTIAKGRTITVLDKEGKVFTRVWCIFELHLTLVGPQEDKKNKKTQEGLWAVYTASRHTYRDLRFVEERDAVGIISGGSTSDCGDDNVTTAREKYFPYQLIKKALTIQVEDAEASEKLDRVHILNSIVGHTGKDLNSNPPKTHKRYSALNDSLRGRFASSAASLQGAVKEGETEWMSMLVAMSKSTSKSKMAFDFDEDSVWSDLTAVQAAQLMAHLPINIESLGIGYAMYGAEFIDAVIQRIKQLNNISYLFISHTTVVGEEGGQEVGVRLAEMLATNTTITDISMWYTNLIDDENKEQWADALLRNETVRFLSLIEMEEKVVDYLKTKTAARSLPLEIEVL